ncbi:IBR domain [Trinorchestia longiramus]|nr:IBR domain [Trinorchestia longiramus]
MGSASSKFKKYLQNGDEYAAMQVFEANANMQGSLDPNASHGESLGHNTALHYAAQHAMKHLFRAFLFDLGGNPNKRNSDDETSLHKLCHVRGPAKSMSAEERRYWCLMMLLHWRGAPMDDGRVETLSLNAKDKEGNTALHYAASSGLMNVTQLLLHANVDIFARNNARFTACHMAAANGHNNIASFLETRMIFADILDPVAPPLVCNSTTLLQPKFVTTTANSTTTTTTSPPLSPAVASNTNNFLTSHPQFVITPPYSDDLDYHIDNGGNVTMGTDTSSSLHLSLSNTNTINLTNVAINNLTDPATCTINLDIGHVLRREMSLDDLEDADRDIISVRNMLLQRSAAALANSVSSPTSTINNNNQNSMTAPIDDLSSVMDLDEDLIDVGLCDDVIVNESTISEADEGYKGLKAHELLEAKDQLLVETSDMLHVPLFTAEALLREYEWSKSQLLEAWMEDPVACCKKASIVAPASVLRRSASTTDQDPARDNISTDQQPRPNRGEVPTPDNGSNDATVPYSAAQSVGMSEECRSDSYAPSQQGKEASNASRGSHDSSDDTSLSRIQDSSRNDSSEMLCGICFDEIRPWDLLNTLRQSSFNNSFESSQGAFFDAPLLSLNNGNSNVKPGACASVRSRSRNNSIIVSMDTGNGSKNNSISNQIVDARGKSRNNSVCYPLMESKNKSTNYSIYNQLMEIGTRSRNNSICNQLFETGNKSRNNSICNQLVEAVTNSGKESGKTRPKWRRGSDESSCSSNTSSVGARFSRMAKMIHNNISSGSSEDNPKSSGSSRRSFSFGGKSQCDQYQSLRRDSDVSRTNGKGGKYKKKECEEREKESSAVLDKKSILNCKKNIGCKHLFCSSCWRAYLSIKIQEGDAHNIQCPAVGCNILVDVEFIERMVSPEMSKRYMHFDIQAFVERNKSLKWCPYPGCGRAVRFPEAELFNFYADAAASASSSAPAEDSSGIEVAAVAVNASTNTSTVAVNFDGVSGSNSAGSGEPAVLIRHGSGSQLNIALSSDLGTDAQSFSRSRFPHSSSFHGLVCGSLRKSDDSLDSYSPTDRAIVPSSGTVREEDNTQSCVVSPSSSRSEGTPKNVGKNANANGSQTSRRTVNGVACTCDRNDTSYLCASNGSSNNNNCSVGSNHQNSNNSFIQSSINNSASHTCNVTSSKNSAYYVGSSNSHLSHTISNGNNVVPSISSGHQIPMPSWAKVATLHNQVPGSSSNNLNEQLAGQVELTPPSHSVDCGNGHFFCWECLREAHSPASCCQWQEWQRKVAEVRPDDLHSSTSGDTAEQAANLLWLVANSKPCPNCKSPIQKNEGCNHMKCCKCKQEFCWVCLESWKKHSSATGGYFRCNRYDAQAKAHATISSMLQQVRSHPCCFLRLAFGLASQRNQEMQELTLFLQHYSRFSRHRSLLASELQLLVTVPRKMDSLATALRSSAKYGEESNVEFLLVAVKELLKARYALCGATVLSYFNTAPAPVSAHSPRSAPNTRSTHVSSLGSGSRSASSATRSAHHHQPNPASPASFNTTLLDCLQGELSSLTERLRGMVCGSLVVHRRATIIATTLLTRHSRTKLVKLVERTALGQYRASKVGVVSSGGRSWLPSSPGLLQPLLSDRFMPSLLGTQHLRQPLLTAAQYETSVLHGDARAFLANQGQYPTSLRRDNFWHSNLPQTSLRRDDLRSRSLLWDDQHYLPPYTRRVMAAAYEEAASSGDWSISSYGEAASCDWANQVNDPRVVHPPLPSLGPRVSPMRSSLSARRADVSCAVMNLVSSTNITNNTPASDNANNNRASTSRSHRSRSPFVQHPLCATRVLASPSAVSVPQVGVETARVTLARWQQDPTAVTLAQKMALARQQSGNVWVKDARGRHTNISALLNWAQPQPLDNSTSGHRNPLATLNIAGISNCETSVNTVTSDSQASGSSVAPNNSPTSANTRTSGNSPTSSNNALASGSSLKRSLLVNCAGCPVPSPSTPSHQYYSATASSSADLDSFGSTTNTTTIVRNGVSLANARANSQRSPSFLSRGGVSLVNTRTNEKFCNLLQENVVRQSQRRPCSGRCATAQKALSSYCTLRRPTRIRGQGAGVKRVSHDHSMSCLTSRLVSKNQHRPSNVAKMLNSFPSSLDQDINFETPLTKSNLKEVLEKNRNAQTDSRSATSSNKKNGPSSCVRGASFNEGLGFHGQKISSCNVESGASSGKLPTDETSSYSYSNRNEECVDASSDTPERVASSHAEEDGASSSNEQVGGASSNTQEIGTSSSHSHRSGSSSHVHESGGSNDKQEDEAPVMGGQASSSHPSESWASLNHVFGSNSSDAEPLNPSTILSHIAALNVVDSNTVEFQRGSREPEQATESSDQKSFMKSSLPDDYDGSLELLIALEMSRLQLIEDEAMRQWQLREQAGYTEGCSLNESSLLYDGEVTRSCSSGGLADAADRPTLELHSPVPSLALSQEFVYGFPNAEGDLVSLEGIRQLSEENIRQLSEESLRQLSEESLRHLSEDGLGQLSDEELRHLSEEELRQLSEEELAHLSGHEMGHLSEQELRHLSEEHLRHLSDEEFVHGAFGFLNEEVDKKKEPMRGVTSASAAEIAVDYLLKALSTKDISMKNLNVVTSKEDRKSEKSMINATLQNAVQCGSADDCSRDAGSRDFVTSAAAHTPKSDSGPSLCVLDEGPSLSCVLDSRFRFGAHETGRFKYGDLHENGHHLFCGRPSSACGRDLKKSHSMSDLRDACSSCSSELALDSDHVHVENPEEKAKIHLVSPMVRANDSSLDVESDVGDVDSSALSNSFVSTTDQGASSEIMGDIESPLTDLEVCGILNHLEKNPSSANRSYHKKLSEPSFQLVVDEGTDKDDSLSTDLSSSSQAPGKCGTLRIKISPSNGSSSPDSPCLINSNNESSNEYESETGIPNSPTLYISGVSICRSPEPKSPKSPRSLWSLHSPVSPHSLHAPPDTNKERSSSLTLPSFHNVPRTCTLTGPMSPEPVSKPRINRSGSYNVPYPVSRNSLSPLPDCNRNRSCSLNVPGTVSPSIARMRRPFSGSNVETSTFHPSLGLNSNNSGWNPSFGFNPSLGLSPNFGQNRAFGGNTNSNKNLTVVHDTRRKTSLDSSLCSPHFHLGLNSHRFRQTIAESTVKKTAPGLTLKGNHLSVAGISNGSSLSLQPTRASTPLMVDLRPSKSASEYEKNSLVFQFPNSPADGALSSVLHVEESNLSSDDFHEALFLNKSPRSSKRKKSKKDRRKDSKIKDREMSKSRSKESENDGIENDIS